MSIFYTGINDLFQPLLLFGILFALLQFSVSQLSNQRQTRLGRILSALSETRWVWFILLVILGGYILFKLGMTVRGWAAILAVGLNSTEPILGQQIPNIDYQMGIGACSILAALLSSLILIIIKYRRGRKYKR